jgi:RND family efflux transporter MFP subunit
MLLLLLCAYAGAIYAIFFKLGWLRWTLPWRVITIGLPIVVLGLLMIWFRLVVPGAVPADGSTYLAADVEQVIPLTSGPVKTVSIKEDKPVKKGQPLFSIDPEPLQQTLTQAKSKLTQAEEAYRQARELVKAGGVSRLDLVTAENHYAAAQAAVEAAQFQLNLSTAYAPFDGFSPIVTLKPGQRVTAGTHALEFVRLDDQVVVMKVFQNQIVNIRPGDKAFVTFKMLPGQVFQAAAGEGQLRPATMLFAPEGSLMGAKTFHVLLRMNDPAYKFQPRPGASGSAMIITSAAGNIGGFVAELLTWMQAWQNYL